MAVELKLLIDKDKGRVAYAESDKCFVDTIFSFLTTTIGTVVRLSIKKSNLGCMDTLYESVENLDYRYLQTPAVKEMLLRPRSALEPRFQDLALSIDPERAKYYKCVEESGFCQLYYSCFSNAECYCGGVMNREKYFKKSAEQGVFLKGNMSFMIADDLSVGLISTAACLSRLSKLGVSNWTNLDMKSVNVNAEEAFHLLKRSLVSKTPLTDVFLSKVDSSEDAVNINPASEDATTERKDSSKKIRVKLMLSKSKKKVLYAEANADFVDLLFSFLTFPLGSIVKLLGPGSSIHCLDNLYKSVEDLSSDDSCIISKDALLEPKLALHWQCENQLLPVMEEAPKETLHFMNPKIKGGTTNCGGGFVNGPKTTFMVTDGLDVKPMSFLLGISIMESFNVAFIDVQEHVVSVGEEESMFLDKSVHLTISLDSCCFTLAHALMSSFPDERTTAALSLLRASLSSKSVLTDVFCRQKLQQSDRDQVAIS